MLKSYVTTNQSQEITVDTEASIEDILEVGNFGKLKPPHKRTSHNIEPRLGELKIAEVYEN